MYRSNNYILRNSTLLFIEYVIDTHTVRGNYAGCTS